MSRLTVAEARAALIAGLPGLELCESRRGFAVTRFLMHDGDVEIELRPRFGWYHDHDAESAHRVFVKVSQAARGRDVARTFPVRKDGTLNVDGIARAITELMAAREKLAEEEERAARRRLDESRKRSQVITEMRELLKTAGLVEYGFEVEGGNASVSLNPNALPVVSVTCPDVEALRRVLLALGACDDDDDDDD